MATMQERALAELDSRYEIRNAREVFRYLGKYPELEGILIEAHSQIHKFFGDNAHAVLDFWQDNEEDEHVSLLITISSKLDKQQVGEKLTILDKWSIHHIPKHSGRLIFEIDFS